jgi:hypothetical protein
MAQEWETLSPLEKCAWHWERISADTLEFLSTLPESRKLDFQADALFAGDEAALGKLFAFVGVDMPRKERIEEVLDLKINSARKGVFPHHSQWSEAQREVVWEKVAGVASLMGYKG